MVVRKLLQRLVAAKACWPHIAKAKSAWTKEVSFCRSLKTHRASSGALRGRARSRQLPEHPPPELTVRLPERRGRQERPSVHLHPDNHAAVEDRVRQEPAARIHSGQLLPVPRDRVVLCGF